MRKLALAQIFLLLTLAASNHSAQSADKDIAERYVLNVRDGWVDLYLANLSQRDLPSSRRLDRFGFGSQVDFVFFDQRGRCEACKFTLQDEAYRMPSTATKPIRPGEIDGLSFSFDEIKGPYGLKQGCYGFYAAIKTRKANRLRLVAASNAAKICIK